MDPPACRNSNTNIYQSLTSPNQIRLLILQQGLGDQPLQGNIRIVSLDEQALPQYEALSYVWGTTTSPRPFLISGNNISITTNLEIALRHLRHEHDQRILWVDAICINQADLNERVAQVLLMARIFQSARKVLAWTGETEPDTEEAVVIMFRLALLETQVHQADRITSSMLKENVFDFKSVQWAKLDHLLTREYWLRVWILQELAVNFENVVFFFGKHNLTGETLDWASIAYIKLFHHSVRADLEEDDFKHLVYSTPSSGLYPAFSTYLIVGRFRGHQSSLRSLLQITSKFKATDPRDKVYALLNLAAETDRQAIKPDYQKSWFQLKADVTIYLMQNGPSDNTLACLQGNLLDPSHPDRERPTWAQIHPQAETINHKWERLNFRPTGDIPTDAKPAPAPSPPGSFIVRGFAVDVVEYAQGPFHGTESELSEQVVNICRAYYRFPIHLRDKIWRGLVMDSEILENDVEDVTAPAPHHFRRTFDYLVWLPRDGSPVPPIPPRLRESIESLVWNCKQVIRDRCIFMTSKCDYFGVGPQGTKKGDLVVALYGSKTCHILRAEDDHWLLVGDAYVQGIMQGELVDDPGGRRSEMTFDLR